MPYEAQELEWGEQTTKLQLVDQTMREVGRILSHKLDSLWDHEIFHYQEHAESFFARGLKCPVVLYWNKDPEKLVSFLGFNRFFFKTRSSEEKTEPLYDALYWSWHWRTPNPEINKKYKIIDRSESFFFVSVFCLVESFKLFSLQLFSIGNL